MLKKFFEFARKEKLYVILFFIIGALYFCFWIFYKSTLKPEQPSAALQEYLKAEEKWHEKISNTEAFEKYLSKRPALSRVFRIFSLFAVMALCLGIFIDFLLLVKPHWREQLTKRGPPHLTAWKISMLFKVIVLWLTASLVLGVVLGFLRHFFPQFSFNFYILFHTTLLDILCFVFIVYVIRQDKGLWRDLGLRLTRKNILREIGVGLGGYLAVLPLFLITLFVIIGIAHLFKYEPPPHPLVEVFLEEEKRSPWLIVYSIVLASFIGPIFEEIFFRGFCYPIFKNQCGAMWGMVLSAAFFSLIHYNQFAFLPIFILGLSLAYLYEKRGSLLAPIVLHIVHNTVFIGYFFLAKHIVAPDGAS